MCLKNYIHIWLCFGECQYIYICVCGTNVLPLVLPILLCCLKSLGSRDFLHVFFFYIDISLRLSFMWQCNKNEENDNVTKMKNGGEWGKGLKIKLQ